MVERSSGLPSLPKRFNNPKTLPTSLEVVLYQNKVIYSEGHDDFYDKGGSRQVNELKQTRFRVVVTESSGKVLLVNPSHMTAYATTNHYLYKILKQLLNATKLQI